MAGNHVDNNPDWSDNLPRPIRERLDVQQDDDVDIEDGLTYLGLKKAGEAVGEFLQKSDVEKFGDDVADKAAGAWRAVDSVADNSDMIAGFFSFVGKIFTWL
ncbi:MAG TPA: hypothetical protein V6D25_29785 [Leptolyngbyaceae cyanobacterium]